MAEEEEDMKARAIADNPAAIKEAYAREKEADEAARVKELADRRAATIKKREEAAAAAAAAPAPAKDPVRVAAARKAAETKRQKAAQKPVDGRDSISWNDHEVDVEAVDAALAAKLINAGADVTAWPKPAVRERPEGRDGAATRPELDAGWDGAFGPDVEVPDEAGLVRWLHKHAWWWELPHNLNDKAVREHVVENLTLCKKHNVRPFQHGWLLSPATWRTLLGKHVTAAARRDFYKFSLKCRRGAAESFARRGLVVPDHCALCALIAKDGTEIAEAVRDFRGAFSKRYGDGDGGDADDETDLAGEEEEEAAGAIIMKKIVQTAGGPLLLVLDHIEHTPIFRYWLCNWCNTRLVATLDRLPHTQIEPYYVRLCDMAVTVSGGIRSGAAPADTDSDDELYAAGFAESDDG